jgi:4-alpha-glucanotransferase
MLIKQQKVTHSENKSRGRLDGVPQMKLARSSGILLHPTSLPGPFGIGDLGPQAFRFAEQLHEAGQKIWQVLPLGPPGKGHSPYQCLSSYAGNPMLLSPEVLVEHGYLSREDISNPPHFPNDSVQFEQVTAYKTGLLRKAFAAFSETPDFHDFAQRAAHWLDPFSCFMGLKAANEGRPWTHFNPQFTPSEQEMRFQKFLQYEFSRQWARLKAHCANLGVSIFGDVPFYLEHDCADVWSNPQFFNLDEKHEPRTVGGVPPDYFSANGQLWGNPTYRWDELEKDGFAFWIERLRATFERVDLARLDHFRGFEAFWEVAAGELTARNGAWRKGPGERFFSAVRNSLGERVIIAENLGVITPEVEALRLAFHFPGMAVLQFGFGDEDSVHRPHNYERMTAAFTGTHDNDTTAGWWDNLKKSRADGELCRAASYLQLLAHEEAEVHWHFMAAIMTSTAVLAIFPLQDVLGLGSEARMNVPGRADGNWGWRVREGAFDAPRIQRLRELTHISGRS